MRRYQIVSVCKQDNGALSVSINLGNDCDAFATRWADTEPGALAEVLAGVALLHAIRVNDGASADPANAFDACGWEVEPFGQHD